MKISRYRPAITQSMDLFILIAAVLAVGGVVTASVYSLAGSASANASIQIVQASASGGGATSVNSVTLTVKNTGSSTISGTMTVTLGGTKQPTTPVASPVPTVTCSATATCSSAATLGGTAGNPVLLSLSSLTIPAGTQVAISEGSISGLTNGWNVGSLNSVSVQFGPAQTSIIVTA